MSPERSPGPIRDWPRPVRWMESVGKEGTPRTPGWLGALGPQDGAGGMQEQGMVAFLSESRLLCSPEPQEPAGGTALLPSCSPDPQKVPSAEIWGDAPVLQLVAKGWGTLEARCCQIALPLVTQTLLPPLPHVSF